MSHLKKYILINIQFIRYLLYTGYVCSAVIYLFKDTVNTLLLVVILVSDRATQSYSNRSLMTDDHGTVHCITSHIYIMPFCTVDFVMDERADPGQN